MESIHFLVEIDKTLSFISHFQGNPIAVSAGIATLNILKKDNPYPVLEKKTKEFYERIEEKTSDFKIKLKVNHIGSIFSLFFTDKKVMDFRSSQTQDVRLFKKFFHSLLKSGVYFSSSAFEVNFLSTAHSAEDLGKILKAIDIVLKNLGRSNEDMAYGAKRDKP